jgi:hypothetical protein
MGMIKENKQGRMMYLRTHAKRVSTLGLKGVKVERNF